MPLSSALLYTAIVNNELQYPQACSTNTFMSAHNRLPPVLLVSNRRPRRRKLTQLFQNLTILKKAACAQDWTRAGVAIPHCKTTFGVSSTISSVVPGCPWQTKRARQGTPTPVRNSLIKFPTLFAPAAKRSPWKWTKTVEMPKRKFETSFPSRSFRDFW